MIRPFLIRVLMRNPSAHESHESSRITSAHHALPVQPARITKIDDDADPQAGCVQIIQELRLFSAADLPHDFELNEHAPKADEIRVILFLKALERVINAQFFLWLE